MYVIFRKMSHLTVPGRWKKKIKSDNRHVESLQ